MGRAFSRATSRVHRADIRFGGHDHRIFAFRQYSPHHISPARGYGRFAEYAIAYCANLTAAYEHRQHRQDYQRPHGSRPSLLC